MKMIMNVVLVRVFSIERIRKFVVSSLPLWVEYASSILTISANISLFIHKVTTIKSRISANGADAWSRNNYPSM